MIKSELIHVAKGAPFTDSLQVAKGVGIEHKNVIALVRKFKTDFEEFGTFAFQTRKSGGRATEYAELNEDQATYLITLLRNTEIVRAFKIRLVKEFRKVVNELTRIRCEPNRKDAIQYKRDAAKPMMDSLLFARDEQGKVTLPHHFSNEHKFVNRACFERYEAIDESMLDAYDTRLLKAARERNTLLIQRFPKQEDRRQMLDDFVAGYRAKHPRLLLVGGHQ